MGRTAPIDDRFVFLAIDSDSVGLDQETDAEQLYGLHDKNSIEARALSAMTRRFPWPREVYGAHPRPSRRRGRQGGHVRSHLPTATDGDEPFREALERYKKHVIIGSNFVILPGMACPPSVQPHAAARYAGAADSPMDDRVAFTNFWPDADDVVRRANFASPSSSSGRPPPFGRESFLSLASRSLTKQAYRQHTAQTRAQQFRYAGPARAGFPPRSIFEIFVRTTGSITTESGEFFRDKIVLIGAEGNWQHDEHPRPRQHARPGDAPERDERRAPGRIHPRSPPRGVARAPFYGHSRRALTLAIPSPWLRLLALVCAAMRLTSGSSSRPSITSRFPCRACSLLTELNGTVLLGLVCDFTLERLEKNRVRRTLERYVSSNVVRELLDHPEAFQQSLGGVMKPVAVLFSDIRGFSPDQRPERLRRRSSRSSTNTSPRWSSASSATAARSINSSATP